MAPKVPGNGIKLPVGGVSFTLAPNPSMTIDKVTYNIVSLPPGPIYCKAFPQIDAAILRVCGCYYVYRDPDNVSEITEDEAEAYQHAWAQYVLDCGTYPTYCSAYSANHPTMDFASVQGAVQCRITAISGINYIGHVFPKTQSATPAPTPATITTTSSTLFPPGTGFLTGGLGPPVIIKNISYDNGLDHPAVPMDCSKPLKCECGATACGSPIHSSWCCIK
jgi:hypothetical protein